ncbi:MAG: cyclopropane fatty acyl phospholipid synthase, partial [Gammaproteobacteria bacterium]|nr:cyclopropane fatty acyl phospholipid synthase [Gammaproteobacteria bacterium]
MPYKRLVTGTLSRAGITINGEKPWDIRVLNNRFYRRTARGSVGLGESYIDGDWEVESLEELFHRLIRAGTQNSLLSRLNGAILGLRARLTNLQSKRRSVAVAEQHYDLDHRMYEQFLGPYNQYTCCFFDGTDDLREAEVAKLEMICDKLEIDADDRVLDIGCGWGGFARYAASTRGCEVTGITLSTEQARYADDFTVGLPVDIVRADYRDLPLQLKGRYDKILICGMIEHVGYKNYGTLMRVVDQMLDDEGLFLLHTIGNSEETRIVDPWIEKYIFRNSMAPSMNQLVDAMANLFVIQDWENYGLYYSKTLLAWQQNFEKNWSSIKAIASRRPFDERFRR